VAQAGVITHPFKAYALKHFNKIHASFAAELRNVRLDLCDDGFSPYSNIARPLYGQL